MKSFLILGLFLFLLFLFAIPARASIANVYIAQTAAGGNTGTDCADAYAYTFFNTSGNWGSGASQIGPGTTVHLCGTFTASPGASNYLVVQGNGASGNPVTIKFETNAILQATYWSGAALSLGSHTYITVDGGTNGLVQATANGTNLANQQNNGVGISGSGSNITIQNMTIANIYVHACTSPATTFPVTTCPDEGGQDTKGIIFSGGSNILITNNTVHDVKWGLFYSFGGVANSNITFSNNTEYNVDHGLFTTDGTAGGATLNGLYVYGNTWHDFASWDDNANGNHHDCTHNDLSQGPPNANYAINVFIYNNYCYGDFGEGFNSAIFLSSQQIANQYTATVFNNVLIDQSQYGHQGCGLICALSGTTNSTSFYNNTLVGAEGSLGTAQGGVAFNFYGPIGSFENNVVDNFYEAMKNGGFTGTWVTFDYNNYYSIGAQGFDGSAAGAPGFSSWQSTCQGQGTPPCDAHGSYSNPNLSTSWLPTSSSTALISHGVNLTSLSVMALDSDKAGVARPTSTAWDIGAYSYSGSSPSINLSPASLAFGNVVNGTTSSSQTITLTNMGGGSLTMTSVTLTGTNAGRFTITANTCTGSIAAAGTCTTTVTFAPDNVTSFSAAVTYTTNAASSPDNAPLSGAGIAAPSSNAGVSPAVGIF